jgi:hypothetical protein
VRHRRAGAILTVHGPRGFDRIASGGLVAAVPAEAVAAHAPLQPDGFIFVPVAPTRWNALRFAGRDAGFGLSFHGLGYIERRWPEVFTTARVVASGSLQEAVLVEP